MPKYIIKLHDDKLQRDWYLEWSTVVDAPTTWGMSLKEFTEHYRKQYGEIAMEHEFSDRMSRVEKQGTSYRLGDVQSVIRCNRAGEKETEATLEQILDYYCRNRP